MINDKRVIKIKEFGKYLDVKNMYVEVKCFNKNINIFFYKL